MGGTIRDSILDTSGDTPNRQVISAIPAIHRVQKLALQKALNVDPQLRVRTPPSDAR
jgi:hypothetical protein